jgi:hypothetical protein
MSDYYKWDKTNRERLYSLLSKGVSYKEAGKKFNISRQRVFQLVRKFKWNPRELSIYARRGLKKNDERQYNFKKYGLIKGRKDEQYKTDIYTAKRKKFNRKKAAAVRLGIPFCVNFGDIEWPDKCPILDIELNYFNEVWEDNSPSFDRIDPDIGYTKDNTHIISYRANRLKNDASLEEITKIYKYLTDLEKKG